MFKKFNIFTLKDKWGWLRIAVLMVLLIFLAYYFAPDIVNSFFPEEKGKEPEQKTVETLNPVETPQPDNKNTEENKKFEDLLKKDPVCKMDIDPATSKYKIKYLGYDIYFCSQECMEKFELEPQKYLPHKVEMNVEFVDEPGTKEKTDANKTENPIEEKNETTTTNSNQPQTNVEDYEPSEDIDKEILKDILNEKDDFKIQETPVPVGDESTKSKVPTEGQDL